MMDQLTQQQIVVRVLRTAGILAAFIGCILVTQTIAAGMATLSASSNLPPGINVQFRGAFGNLTAWAIVGQLATVAWGMALFAVAKPIAARIVAD